LNTTRSASPQVAPITVSPPLYRAHKRSPVRRAASQPASPYSCVPPTLHYSSSSNMPANTPSSSRIASSVTAQSQMQASYHPLAAEASTSASSSRSRTSTPRASTTLSRPASSLLLSKPFHFPQPNCNKSYKQANELKVPYDARLLQFRGNSRHQKDLEHCEPFSLRMWSS
jgi:hypothetical protein